MKKTTDELLDHGWIELITYAKKIGLSIEDVQFFLNSCSGQK
ncbi:anti-repressor SinI family protein [Bacillaceae bacterium IKA-2]|nr:anti-repressor SinI family protein [Bacillaceae bacterium IKA-2]